MGQSEVIELLKKEREPISARDISLKINASFPKTMRDLNAMMRYNEVLFVEIDRFEAMKRYHCKKRMKLYYVKPKKNGNR